MGAVIISLDTVVDNIGAIGLFLFLGLVFETLQGEKRVNGFRGASEEERVVRGLGGR